MNTMTDEKTMKLLAANLVRRMNGTSYSELARRVGVAPIQISCIARGKNMPGLGLVTRIAEALKCTVDDLLDEPTPKRKPS